MGIYNKLTKDYLYKYRNSGFLRNTNFISAGSNNQPSITVDLQGKAGSYRKNVSVTMYSASVSTSYNSFVVISSSWSLFENGISSYTSATSASSNPTFYADYRCPLSVKISSGMYLSIFPFQITPSITSFTFYLDNIHMPYHYDLPNYYIFVISGGWNDMLASNQF